MPPTATATSTAPAATGAAALATDRACTRPPTREDHGELACAAERGVTLMVRTQ
jgi:hypothetical protein